MSGQPMEIAVIGTGITGLAACKLLSDTGHCVTLFEKNESLAMDALAVEYVDDGQRRRSDVPPRMFQPSLWPQLSFLYQSAGVKYFGADTSKSYSRVGENTFLTLGIDLRPKISWHLLAASTRNIGKEIRRLKERAEADLLVGLPDDLTMGQYLKANEYSDAFIYDFLYPSLSSTVCTCDFRALDQYPASILLDALVRLTKGDSLQRTSLGTADVVSRLSAGAHSIRLSCNVQEVGQSSDSAWLLADGGDRQSFDHVIVATQANHVPLLVKGLSEDEVRIFTAFRYRSLNVVVHRDRTLMPPKRKDWSAFNIVLDPSSQQAMCSIWLDRFYQWPESASPVFQTIMPLIQPKEEDVLAQNVMQRPVVDSASLRAIGELEEIHQQPGRRVWFCGSYARRGIPLLESAVASVYPVLERIGVKVPNQTMNDQVV